MADCPDAHSDLQPGYTIWYDCAHRTRITMQRFKLLRELGVRMNYIVISYNKLSNVRTGVMESYDSATTLYVTS